MMATSNYVSGNKYKGSLRSLFLTFLLLALSPTGFCAEPRKVSITTGDYPPWTGESLPNHGYVNHIVSEAFRAVGMEVEFVYMPWKRAFEEARKGNYEATSYWFDNTERSASMLLSEPLILNRTVFFQRMEDPPITWEKLSDLADYRMSATLGFTYTEEFLQAALTRSLPITMVPTDVQNIKMLMSRRVDLIATDEMSGFYMAATLSLDPRKLRVLEPPMVTAEGYLMASKSNPSSAALVAQFNEGLKIIRSNGTYKKILDRIDNSSFYNPQL